MVGSVRPRMLSITLPYIDAWNVWWSDYGNTPDGFAELKAKSRPAGRRASAARRAACRQRAQCSCSCLVATVARWGRTARTPVEPIRGSASEVAEQIGAFAAAGAEHVQLCVDPINRDSIEWFAEMFAVLDR